jgi:DNA-binding response OmpR family regulator
MARIIIADDDELVVDMVRSVLEARGHIVGSLEDGSRVKQVVETKRPDLVILDCSMPEKSGIQVLRELRTSLIAHETPVLVLTGRRSLNDEGIAWNAGTDDYLRKPFDPDELVVRVEALLDSAA